MKFMMFVCGDDTAPKEIPDDTGMTIDEWVEEMDAKGIRVEGSVLSGGSDARTVKVRDGDTLITDGPYADVKEQLGGFDILECANLDEALEVASKHPMARAGVIEVRQFIDL